jgi:hypothetical protein
MAQATRASVTKKINKYEKRRQNALASAKLNGQRVNELKKKLKSL